MEQVTLYHMTRELTSHDHVRGLIAILFEDEDGVEAFDIKGRRVTCGWRALRR